MRGQPGQHIRAALQRLLSALDGFGYVALNRTPDGVADAMQLTDRGRDLVSGTAASERVERIARRGRFARPAPERRRGGRLGRAAPILGRGG
jgi:hypothetical protein